MSDIRLKRRLKRILVKYPKMADIILFGSSARGKENPRDWDILVLFEKEIDKTAEYSVRKELEEDYTNISIISKTEKSILEESFDAREGILFEGKSLVSGKRFAQRYGFLSFGAFKYNFEGWSKLKKTKFYYALNGRGKENGIARQLDCVKLSDSLILAPLEKIEKFKEFLDGWKINYHYIPLLLPTRLGRKKILESRI